MNIVQINLDNHTFTVEMYKPEGMFQVTNVEWDLLVAALKTNPTPVECWIEKQHPSLPFHHMTQIMIALRNPNHPGPVVRLTSAFPKTVEFPMAIYNLCSRLNKEESPITGIKFLREFYAMGLKDAKDLYDAIKAHAPQEPNPLGDLLQSRIQSVVNEVRNNISSGRYVQAIKDIRNQWGLGLKDAKDIVDCLRDGNSTMPFNASMVQVEIFAKLKS